MPAQLLLRDAPENRARGFVHALFLEPSGGGFLGGRGPGLRKGFVLGEVFIRPGRHPRGPGFFPRPSQNLLPYHRVLLHANARACADLCQYLSFREKYPVPGSLLLPCPALRLRVPAPQRKKVFVSDRFHRRAEPRIHVSGMFVFILVLVPTLAYLSGLLEGGFKLKPIREILQVIVVEGVLAGLGLCLGFPCLILHPSNVIFQTYQVILAVKQGLGILYPYSYRQIPWLLFLASGFVGFGLFILGLLWYLGSQKETFSDPARKIANYLLIPAILFFLASYATVRRMDLHYLTPYLPFFLAFAALLLESLYQRSRAIALVLIALSLLWLAGLSAAIDYQLYHDTRTQAKQWISENIPAQARIERTSWLFTFDPEYHPEMVDWSYRHPRPPTSLILASRKIKCRIRSWDPASVNLNDLAEYDARWEEELKSYIHRFSEPGLRERNPDYIIASSGFYNRYLLYPNQYPSVKTFWENLLAGKAGYTVIKKFSPPRIVSLTTQYISPEIVILKRNQ